MKKKIFWGLVSFFLCACGNDSGSNANSPETEPLVSEISSSEISYSSESNATPDKESPSSGKSALSSSSAAETQSSDTASDAPLSSGTVTGTQSSSSAAASTTSSSSATQSGSGPAGGISFPQERGCRPTAPVESETFGVVDAFIQKRVEVLVQQGLSNDSARDIAIEELQRELGLDTLFQENPYIAEYQLEYTLFFLYGNKSENTLNQDLVDDFADGTLEADNYCINQVPYAALDGYPMLFMPLGCAISMSEINNPLAIMRNIWRKCAGMPYCNASVGDTMITLDKDHFVCEEGSWVTLEMLGKEKNGVICTNNGDRVVVRGNDNNDMTYICLDSFWRAISNTASLPAEYFLNPDFEYGTFEDPRDGHVYKTTVYEGKTWLAQDIDYYDKDDPLFVNQSKCAKIAEHKKHDPSENAYCDGASRFYTVNVIKKVCPTGWRLPTKEDWNHITEMSYSEADKYYPKLYAIGTHIQGNTRVVTDEFGLSLRKNGGVDPYGMDMTLSGYNLFWVEEGEYAMNSDFFAHYEKVDPRENGEYVPVRCIKE